MLAKSTSLTYRCLQTNRHELKATIFYLIFGLKDIATSLTLNTAVSFHLHLEFNLLFNSIAFVLFFLTCCPADCSGV